VQSKLAASATASTLGLAIATTFVATSSCTYPDLCSGPLAGGIALLVIVGWLEAGIRTLGKMLAPWFTTISQKDKFVC
jgi:hypothetical protein